MNNAAYEEKNQVQNHLSTTNRRC